MKEIIEILIKRDGMTYEEAKNYTIEGMEEVMEMADVDNFDAELLFEELFGLEPDYLINAIFDFEFGIR